MRHIMVVPCSAGGGGGGLVLPGNGGRRKTAAEIAAEREELRRQQAGQNGQPASQTSGGDLIMNSGQRSFRPPPGFIDATLRGEQAPTMDEREDVETMLGELRSESGKSPVL